MEANLVNGITTISTRGRTGEQRDHSAPTLGDSLT
jgi:hypothetical protein